MKIHSAEPIKNINDVMKINKYFKKNNYMAYVLWQTGLNTGLRVIDILRLNVGDVLNKSSLAIIEQKTKKIKKFPIVRNLQELLDDFCQGRNSDEPLFLGKHGKRLDRRTAYRYLVEGCKKIGIKEHIGTHTMRKTFGYHHYQKFKDPVILQKIFNHSSMRITLIYIGVEQDEIDASYNNFSYFFEQKETIKKVKTTDKEKSVIKFLKNYINNGDNKYKEFAELALQKCNLED